MFNKRDGIFKLYEADVTQRFTSKLNHANKVHDLLLVV